MHLRRIRSSCNDLGLHPHNSSLDCSFQSWLSGSRLHRTSSSGLATGSQCISSQVTYEGEFVEGGSQRDAAGVEDLGCLTFSRDVVAVSQERNQAKANHKSGRIKITVVLFYVALWSVFTFLCFGVKPHNSRAIF